MRVLLLLITMLISLACGSNQMTALPAHLEGRIVLKMISLAELAVSKEGLKIGVVANKSLVGVINDIASQSPLALIRNSEAIVMQEGKPMPDVLVLGEVPYDEFRLWAERCYELMIWCFVNDEERLDRGILFALYDDEGIPGVSISLEASKRLSLSWSESVLKVIKIVDGR